MPPTSGGRLRVINRMRGRLMSVVLLALSLQQLSPRAGQAIALLAAVGFVGDGHFDQAGFQRWVDIASTDMATIIDFEVFT